ncbi:hypothetical protein J6590_049158 [Homalodisca vitripennis]|nr:hypothetical protein J6590_049158 [Homalodisca vitripennis]
MENRFHNYGKRSIGWKADGVSVLRRSKLTDTKRGIPLLRIILDQTKGSNIRTTHRKDQHRCGLFVITHQCTQETITKQVTQGLGPGFAGVRLAKDETGVDLSETFEKRTFTPSERRKNQLDNKI